MSSSTDDEGDADSGDSVEDESKGLVEVEVEEPFEYESLNSSVGESEIGITPPGWSERTNKHRRKQNILVRPNIENKRERVRKVSDQMRIWICSQIPGKVTTQRS